LPFWQHKIPSRKNGRDFGLLTELLGRRYCKGKRHNFYENKSPKTYQEFGSKTLLPKRNLVCAFLILIITKMQKNTKRISYILAIFIAISLVLYYIGGIIPYSPLSLFVSVFLAPIIFFSYGFYLLKKEDFSGLTALFIFLLIGELFKYITNIISKI